MSDEENHLKRFYISLSDNLRREKRSRENSVLLSFLKTRSASRYRLLRKSALNSALIPREVLTTLLSKGFIQCIEGIDSYSITAKGVWHYEREKDLMNQETLLSYINDEYFIPTIKGDLNDREKVILFMMISTRTFSEKSTVDLHKRDAVKDKWREMLERSYDLLDDLNILMKPDKESFLGKKGNIHVVSSIFRHNNQMVQKTRGIYIYTGKHEYYLNLYKNSNFSQNNLSYLFWKVFKGDIPSESVDRVIEYCNEISKEESIFLFDMPEHAFSMPKYDTMIKDGLMDSIISRDKWSRIH